MDTQPGVTTLVLERCVLRDDTDGNPLQVGVWWFESPHQKKPVPLEFSGRKGGHVVVLPNTFMDRVVAAVALSPGTRHMMTYQDPNKTWMVMCFSSEIDDRTMGGTSEIGHFQIT